MEYTKDLILKVQYEKNSLKKGWTSKITHKLKKHQWIVGTITIGLMLVMVDSVLVTSFMKVLTSI